MPSSPLYDKLAFQGYHVLITYTSKTVSSYNYLTREVLERNGYKTKGSFPSPEEVGESHFTRHQSCSFMGKHMGTATLLQVVCSTSRDVLYERKI